MPTTHRRTVLKSAAAFAALGAIGHAAVAAAPIKPGSAALIVVDVQNCFLEGGTLAVKGGNQVIPVINRLATAFGPAELPVGLLAALVGAPAFLALFIVTARRS